MCPQLQVPHLAPGMNPPHSDTDDTYDADEEDSGTIRTRRGAQTSVPTAGDPRAAPGPNGEVRGIVSLWSRFSPRTLLSTGLGIASIALYICDSVILPIPPKWHDAFQVTAPSKVGGVKACFQPPISGMSLDSSSPQEAVFRFPNGPLSLPMPCWEVNPDTVLFSVLKKGSNDEVVSRQIRERFRRLSQPLIVMQWRLQLNNPSDAEGSSKWHGQFVVFSQATSESPLVTIVRDGGLWDWVGQRSFQQSTPAELSCAPAVMTAKISRGRV